MSFNNDSNTFLTARKTKGKSLVGQSILTYCGRCKMDLTHTILAVGVGNKHTKVMCNTCKSERAYRAPQIKNKTHSKETVSMDRDDDVMLDFDAGAKKLIGDDELGKRKSKNKSRTKKQKDEGEVKVRSSPQIPLSMQAASPEDLSQYEARLTALKNDLSLAKDYKVKEKFKTGEIIKHQVFGIGFVVAETGINKMEVLFSQGRKLLAMGL